MAKCTMEELLRAPTKGYEEAIVLPKINADPFKIKMNLLQLVQANPFNGRENENPHAHINSFKRITSTLRFRNVPNDGIRSGSVLGFQESTAQIPPPVIPISVPEPDVPTTLPKTTPILESNIPKSLPKPNIPYPSRRDDQKSHDKALNQMEKIFQIFEYLRFDISFADALLLMPKFAPTIKRIDVWHALADLGASINLMPLSIWKKLSLPELTPTRMTLELTGRALIDVYGEEITLQVDNKAVTFNLDQTTRYSSTNDKSVNRIDIIDVVCEEYDPELLGFPNSSGGNPTPTSKPFTSEFILEEIEAYLKDDSISPEIDHADCNPEEDICLIEKLLNNDPF
ncbi:reverse transcriptase domain-containing protein [Tanacetum coccineum]